MTRSQNSAPFVDERLQSTPPMARKLFDVIVREAYHGPLRGKLPGTATPPEILEACGIDVGDFYDLLKVLEIAGLICISNAYPFEEICLSLEAAEAFQLAPGRGDR